MQKRVLVIGGSGFIGERAVEALRARGMQVSAPSHQALDLRDIAALRVFLASHDAVLLLTQPDTQGTTAFASALALSTPKHVIYASTALLYGSSTEPQSEDAPLAPATPYEQAKFDEEAILRAAKGGHTLTIARLGNVYGGNKNKGVISKALRAMYGGEPLEVSGELQLRDFIHVADVAEALAHLADVRLEGVCNVSTGIGTTIDQALTGLERAAGRGIPWVRGAEGVRKDIVASNRRLAAAGCTPKVNLQEGLKAAHQEYARSISK